MKPLRHKNTVYSNNPIINQIVHDIIGDTEKIKKENIKNPTEKLKKLFKEKK